MKAHNGSLELVQAEIRASTPDDLMDRSSVDRQRVRAWESVFKAHAKRVCIACRAVFLATEMAKTFDGRVGQRCAGCDDGSLSRSREYQRKLKAHNARAQTIADEIRALPLTILRSVSLRLSDMTGNWNRYSRGEG
jgi:hypothetical protein